MVGVSKIRIKTTRESCYKDQKPNKYCFLLYQLKKHIWPLNIFRTERAPSTSFYGYRKKLEVKYPVQGQPLVICRTGMTTQVSWLKIQQSFCHRKGNIFVFFLAYNFKHNAVTRINPKRETTESNMEPLSSLGLKRQAGKDNQTSEGPVCCLQTGDTNNFSKQNKKQKQIRFLRVLLDWWKRKKSYKYIIFISVLAP